MDFARVIIEGFVAGFDFLRGQDTRYHEIAPKVKVVELFRRGAE
jgi:hypothetical protein